jgi:hypothetical protein
MRKRSLRWQGLLGLCVLERLCTTPCVLYKRSLFIESEGCVGSPGFCRFRATIPASDHRKRLQLAQEKEATCLPETRHTCGGNSNTSV